MLELREIANVYSGVSARESRLGSSRFMRLADLTDVKAGRVPSMAHGDPPEVARALPIEKGDLIVAARGSSTDVCTANESIVGSFISLDLYLVRPQPRRIESEYLRTVLELPATQAVMATEKQGSGLARLPKEALEKTVIPLPPLHQQRMIAELAVCLEREQELLKQIGQLKRRLGRQVLTRAISGLKTTFSGGSA
jgi:restriction endonuclease S subunit